jgi:TetR/AcrR family transcriptional regulator, transcriptional repressor of aconitase
VERIKEHVRGKEAILEAASDLIRSRGVAGGSIADVIAASGTSAGSIYHHFKSRHALVMAVTRRALEGPLESALRLPGEQEVSPSALFGAAIQRVARDEQASSLLIQIWAAAAGDEALRALLIEEIGGLHWAVAAQLRAWCVSHDVLPQAHAIAQVVVGLVTGFVVQSSTFKGSFDPEAYIELGTRILSGVV